MFRHIHDASLPYADLDVKECNGVRHYVTPSGNIYPSVTTVLGQKPSPELDAWRKRVGEKEADGEAHRAGVRGSAVHDALEEYLANREAWRGALTPFEMRSVLQIKEVLDATTNNIRLQETAVYSDIIKVAGRLDLLAEYNGVLSVIDFKTSKRVKKREWIEGYFMQSSVYAACLYELLGIRVKQIVIIIANDDINKASVFVEQPLNYLSKFIELRKTITI